MILVCHGPQPLAGSRERSLYEGYARRAPVIYLDADPSPFRLCPGAQRVGLLPPCPLGGGRILEQPLVGSLPGNRFRAVSALNRWLGIRRVLRALRGISKEPSVLIVQRPDLIPTLRGLHAVLAVYEVVDDYVALAGTPEAADRMRRAQARLLRDSDVVWVTSTQLADDIRPLRPDVVESSNGVDALAFAAGRPQDAPAALAEAPHPRIGMAGNLNDRVDWALLEELARLRPGWTLVLVGPEYEAGAETRRGLRRLGALPNVVRIPGVPERELPACIAALDVALIPYRLNAGTRRINPLKVYQYLAAGKPVIATPLPSLLAMGRMVFCRCDTEGFVGAIEESLSTLSSDALAKARKEFAGRFDWDQIAASRLEHLERRLHT